MEFTIEGPPIGKARPRVTRAVTYTPAKTARYEDLVRYTAINSFKGIFDKDEPLDVKIIAYFEIPKQAQKIARDADDVVFAKAIRYSHHAISIGELAEILTQNGFVIGRNQLFQLLREEKYLSGFKNSWNIPMTSMVKRGLFRITHGLTRDGRGYSQTWVTPKGQKHIINKALRGKFDDAYQNVMVSTLNI